MILHYLDGLNLVKVDQDTEIRKVQDINAEDSMIYKINPNTKPYTSSYPSKPYTNDSIGGMHINLPSMNERVVTNQMQGGYRWVPYTARMRTDTRNIQNTLHRLQRENYLLKAQLMSYTRPNVNMHKMRGVTFPGPNRMNQFLPRYPTEFSMGHKAGNPISAPRLAPYPYFTNSDLKNVTLQDDIGKTTSLVSKPAPLNVNSEFSDEMKRQLRDGKVILLSDSVVRSNFEPEKERDEETKKEQNEGEKEIKVIPPEVGETGIQAPKLVSG